MGDWLKVFVVFRGCGRTEGPYAKVGWFENMCGLKLHLVSMQETPRLFYQLTQI